MGFSQKIKAFFEEKGLNNRQVSQIMGGYSESLISRYTNSDKIFMSFLNKLVKYFPEIDINYMIKDDEAEEEESAIVPAVASEPNGKYGDENRRLIKEIQERLDSLSRNLSQN